MDAESTNSQHGFTLTELAVTLVIAAVVSAMALPSLSSMVRNTRVKQTATDMVMTLAYARNEAISRNAQVSVVALGGWSAGWQVVTGATMLRQSVLSGEVTVTGPATNTVTYNANGRLATLSTVTFAFTVPGNAQVVRRCVSATLMGQPVLQTDNNRDGDCSNG